MPDPQLDRVLAGAPSDPADDRAREACAAVAAQVLHVEVPADRLPGWSSLCSAEYAEQVRRLHHLIGIAWSACVEAGRPS